MNNFLKNLIQRHSQPAGNIKPRLPGIFESGHITPATFTDSENYVSIASEREEKTDNLTLANTFEKKVGKMENESVFHYNTISNTERKGIDPVGNIGDKFRSDNNSGDNSGDQPKSKQTNHAPGVKKEFANYPEMKESHSNSSDKDQKTILNKLQIKPEIKKISENPVLPNKKMEERSISDKIVNKKKVLPKKKISSVPGKEISPENKQIGNMGLKLPERFNTWLNEPAQQPQTKEKDDSLSQTIKVNIGRIEVRAVTEQATTPVTTKPEAFKPKLSLDDYLNQRNGGKR